MTYWAIKTWAGNVVPELHFTRVQAIAGLLKALNYPHGFLAFNSRGDWRESLENESINAWRRLKCRGYCCIKVTIQEVL